MIPSSFLSKLETISIAILVQKMNLKKFDEPSTFYNVIKRDFSNNLMENDLMLGLTRLLRDYPKQFNNFYYLDGRNLRTLNIVRIEYEFFCEFDHNSIHDLFYLEKVVYLDGHQFDI